VKDQHSEFLVNILFIFSEFVARQKRKHQAVNKGPHDLQKSFRFFGASPLAQVSEIFLFASTLARRLERQRKLQCLRALRQGLIKIRQNHDNVTPFL